LEHIHESRKGAGKVAKLAFPKPSNDSTVTTAGQKWTNGLNSSFALKLGFIRNLEFTAF
jgi:hypothetical protein